MWKSILHNVKYKQRIASVDIQLIIKNNINNNKGKKRKEKTGRKKKGEAKQNR